MNNIEILNANHLPIISEHLKRMGLEDRFLRFGHFIKDDSIDLYLSKINLNRDIWLGTFDNNENGDLKLTSFCHLCGYSANGYPMLELGLSVDQDYRNKKIAYDLIKKSFEIAKSKNILKVVLHTMRENTPMYYLVKKLNGYIETEDNEITLVFDVQVKNNNLDINNYFDEFGIEVFEKQVGSDKTILFVHGAGGDAWQWRLHLMPYFAKNNINTVAISLPNHGLSEKNVENDVAFYIEQIRRWHNKLGKDTIIVAHSMGGYLVQKYASITKEKDQPIKIFLLASVPPFNFASLTSNLVDVIDARLVEIKQNNLFEIARKNLPSINTENITSEIICIAGKDDKVIPLDWKKKLSFHYKSPLYIVEGGHNLMLNKSWNNVADIILENVA